ncbi:MAG: PhoH family protein [Luteibaculum sp.]
MELELELTSIDPMLILGVNNARLGQLQDAFPKIKIHARGNVLRLVGDQQEIEAFAVKIGEIEKFYQKYNRLSDKDFDDIISNRERSSWMKGKGGEVLLYGNNGAQIQAKTVNQKRIVEACNQADMVFAIGPAGTGKTYTAVALAVRALKNKEVKKIILTRPAVEAGEHLGFLPGDLREKLDPYLQPLYDALREMIPAARLVEFLEDGVIQIAPLAFMRGRTLDKAFVILDEAQNATRSQLKMFLTRMGANAKFVVTGDVTQIDLPKKSQSGLHESLHILERIEGVSIVRLDNRDIIRHPLVDKIVQAYEKDDERRQQKNAERNEND